MCVCICRVIGSILHEKINRNIVLYVKINKKQQINVFFIAYSSIISVSFSIFAA